MTRPYLKGYAVFAWALLLASFFALVARAVQYVTFEQITVTQGSAIGLTAANINVGATHPQAVWATCRVSNAEISFREDGIAPTASVGVLAEVGDQIPFNDTGVMLRFSAIATTSTSGTLNCHEGN